MAKSWTEKFHNGEEPVVAPSIRKVSGFPVGSQMLIPTPAQVDDYIRSIPYGEERTVLEMGQDLAKASGADLTCPSSCRSFLRVCAEKAFEDVQAGRPVGTIAPFWRMITRDSTLRKRLSFGVELVDSMRLAEGLEVPGED